MEAERFKMPSYEELAELALSFGNPEISQVVDMVAMTRIVLERLYENGDIRMQCQKEREINKPFIN
jgi:hypothetical protein